MTQRNAAGQIWPNLKTGDQAPKQPQRVPSLASVLYPALSVEARRWAAQREADRRSLLEALREANEKADARLRRSK